MPDTTRRPTGGAGESAQAKAAELWAASRRRRLLTASGAVLAVALLAWWLAGLRLAAGAACLTVATVILVRARRHDDAAAWRKGAAGERRTARLLSPLTRQGYVVLHDRALPHGRANVDHLVIGPAGVVVVDSKNWHRRTSIHGRGGRVWIGKRPAANILAPLTYETQSVATALDRAIGHPVPVTPLVAVHGARMPRWSALTVDGITMLRARRARRWIAQLPDRLTPAEVRELADWTDRLFPPKAS